MLTLNKRTENITITVDFDCNLLTALEEIRDFAQDLIEDLYDKEARFPPTRSESDHHNRTTDPTPDPV